MEVIAISTKEGEDSLKCSLQRSEVWAPPGSSRARLYFTDRSVRAPERTLLEDLLCSLCAEHLATRVITRYPKQK